MPDSNEQRPGFPEVPGGGVVEVLPLGRLDQTAVAVVAANIQTLLGLNVDVLEAEPEPEYAWLGNRKQFDAGPILKALAQENDRQKIRLGLMSGDICLPILTHVFGEAQMGGFAAVVSIHRLGNISSSRQVGTGPVYERLIKVALHETAHVLGVSHCRVEGCLMNFSQKLEHLDQLEVAFCSHCQEEIKRLKKRFGPPSGS